MDILKLRDNMCLEQTEDDHQFSQWLLDVGHGRNCDQDGYIEIPRHMVTYNEDHLILRTYGDIREVPKALLPKYFLDRAILAPRNTDVQQTNAKILESMPGEELIYDSADTIEQDGASENHHDDIPQDFFHSLEPPSLPLAHLNLKIGCPIMLLRNLDPSKGLCNGTQMILLRAYCRALEVVIIGGDHHGEKAFIPRISLKPTEKHYPFILKRRQFPIQLCFAMTINKAQGQSLKHVGLHLLSPVFCHGQLYVALSRATSSKNITVLLPTTPLGMARKTMNMVYPEVLID